MQSHSTSRTNVQPGLVMLKIDGLSLGQAQSALSAKRLPYLAGLLDERSHRLRPLYSGVPSTTPAVQGELFYGVKSSVPAIAYFDRRLNTTVNLLFPVFAGRLAHALESRGRALLEGGTAYSNVYSGGAKEARYCIETMKLRSMRQMASFVKLVALLAVHPLKLLRMLGYAMVETGLSLYDFGKGVVDGNDPLRELKFIPARVLICAVVRELIRTRVKMDLAGGVPIIHASFLGYDEQAHRRGPDSTFAHWALRGIDDVIADIHQAALRSVHRGYRLVVYSDHGQEKALPFRKRFGKSVESVVADAAAALKPGNRRTTPSPVRRGSTAKVRVVALGPIGHVYFSGTPTGSRKARLARVLVEEGGIPMVLFVSEGKVAAVNRHGRFDPVEDPAAILGPRHAFAAMAAEDLVRTCRHADAGDLVLSGWSPDGPPLTFAEENGAHGGPGREETRAFVITPEERPMAKNAPRPSDLRAWVFDFFERGRSRQTAADR